MYFGVADTDRVAEIAMRTGGAVLAEPSDSPFGRMAMLQDPYGGVFEVIEPSGEMPARSG